MIRITTNDWEIIRDNLSDTHSLNKTFLTEDLFQIIKNDYIYRCWLV